MDTWLDRGRSVQHGNHAQKRLVRTRHDDPSPRESVPRFQSRSNENDSGAALRKLFRVPLIGEKAQVASTRPMEWRDGVDLRRGVADDSAAEHVRKRRGGEDDTVP